MYFFFSPLPSPSHQLPSSSFRPQFPEHLVLLLVQLSLVCLCSFQRHYHRGKKQDIAPRGAAKPLVRGKSFCSLLTSSRVTSNLLLIEAFLISQDIAYSVQASFTSKRFFTFFWSAAFNFPISTISLSFSFNFSRIGVLTLSTRCWTACLCVSPQTVFSTSCSSMILCQLKP